MYFSARGKFCEMAAAAAAGSWLQPMKNQRICFSATCSDSETLQKIKGERIDN